MTLQQRLNKYIEKYCLSGAETARRTGLHVTQISDIRVRNQYSAAMAEKIYKALGDEFKEYFEYSICPFCGSKYIPRNNRQKSCMDNECVKKNKAIMMKEYQKKVHSGEHVMKTYNERRPKRETRPKSKQSVSYAEYNERARSQGLSYGQLQGLERLGLR